MSDNNLPVTRGKQADGPIRLRVDISGLSEETRRELGLVGFEPVEQNRTAGRDVVKTASLRTAKGPALTERRQGVNAEEVQQAPPALAGGEAGASVPASPSRIEEHRSGVDARPEPGSRTDVLEHDRAPARTGKEEEGRQNEEAWLPGFEQPLVKRNQAGRAQGFDESQDAPDQSGETIFAGREGLQWSQGDEQNTGKTAPGTEPGREVQDRNAGNETLGEGYNQAWADGLTWLRPGRARSGAGANARSQAGPEPATAGGRAEAERWQELQGAVKQNLAQHQQTHAALLQALRDSARLQAAQRAELDGLADQVRRLLGQNANAGFNRQ